MYFKRLSWGLNGLVCVKHLKHCLPSSKCFWKRCLRIYYCTLGTVLLSGRGVKSGPCSVRAHCSVGGGAAQITCVRSMPLAMAEAWLWVSQIEYLSCFLKLRNCPSEGAGEGHFIYKIAWKQTQKGEINLCRGRLVIVSESLVTGPIYTSGCPSLCLPLPWFIQRKSMFLYWS